MIRWHFVFDSICFLFSKIIALNLSVAKRKLLMSFYNMLMSEKSLLGFRNSYSSKRRSVIQGFSVIKIAQCSLRNSESISEFFSLLRQCVGKRNCRRLSGNLCILRRHWLRHTSAFCRRL